MKQPMKTAEKTTAAEEAAVAATVGYCEILTLK